MLCWTGWIIPGINFFPFLCKSVPGKKKMFARVTGRYGQTLKSSLLWKGGTKGKDFNLSHSNNWDLFWFVDLVFFWEAGLREWELEQLAFVPGLCQAPASGICEVQSWDLSTAWSLTACKIKQTTVSSFVSLRFSACAPHRGIKRCFTTFKKQDQTVNSVFYCHYQAQYIYAMGQGLQCYSMGYLARVTGLDWCLPGLWDNLLRYEIVRRKLLCTQ